MHERQSSNEITTGIEGVSATSIKGIYFIERPYYSDDRGGFQETFRLSQLRSLVPDFAEFKQGNLSDSVPGVLRGIHAEPWYKLVFPAYGSIRVGLVDMRANSPTLGDYIIKDLHGIPGQKRTAILVPPGVGNSFLVIGDTPVVYNYTVGKEYVHMPYPSLHPFDPDLGIDWGVPQEQIKLSPKDIQNPSWKEYSSNPYYK